MYTSMRLDQLTISIVSVLLMSCFANCDDLANQWHQWRGPDANGVSRTADPPVTWSEKENIKWKVAIEGRGTSTPIIWGDRIFLLTTLNTGEKDSSIPDPKDQPKTNFFDIKRPNTKHEFIVLCLERKSGRELWSRVVSSRIPDEGTHNDNDYASASPVTDGKHLYCWFGSAGLFCFDLNGKKIWERDLGKVKVESSLGEGCSPVLHDGKLVVLRDNAGQSTIEVLNATSGKSIWKKDRDERTAWATPLVVKRGGTTQIITAASSLIRSYDLESGEMIWKCGGLTGNVIPCPVLEGDYVICMSGYQGYSAMSIPLTETGDITDSDKIRWKKKRGTPYIPSPLLYDGLLFYNQGNQPIVSCHNSKSGDVAFGPQRVRQLSNIYASPVGASGRVYIVGRNGKTIVLERSEKFRILSTNQLNERFDASPATAGKQLFLRGDKHLYCIEEK